MSARATATLEFALPSELAAHEPPEARGLARDAVRLMVSDPGADALGHTRFHELPRLLRPGDLLVVNASATLPAAFAAQRDGERIRLHLSTELAATRWVVELRREDGPILDARTGESIRLPAHGHARLLIPYRGSTRLWVAELTLPLAVHAYLLRYGQPIRYGYVAREWPLRYYQTVFAREPGSAELPSAARPFTPALVQRLERQGIRIAPLVLHAGVSSLDDDERPYPERFRVPAATARLVNATRSEGGRVIAVGTTVVRALETAAEPEGRVHEAAGWTDVVITPERGVSVIDGLLTGFHAPRASHLQMLEAIAGADDLAAAYASAIEHGYLWHEFGDSHLLLRS